MTAAELLFDLLLIAVVAYCLARVNLQSVRRELLSLAFDIGDPLIELQSIKRVLQTKADSALSPGESA